MKLYLCTWGTNYGLDCCIVSAKNEENARKIAINERIAWEGVEANEIIPSNKEEVIHIDFYHHS